MPLIQGYSPETISKNIKQLIRDGYSPRQAQAIALEIARKAKAKSKK